MTLDQTVLHGIHAALTGPFLDFLMPKITALGNGGAPPGAERPLSPGGRGTNDDNEKGPTEGRFPSVGLWLWGLPTGRGVSALGLAMAAQVC